MSEGSVSNGEKIYSAPGTTGDVGGAGSSRWSARESVRRRVVPPKQHTPRHQHFKRRESLLLTDDGDSDSRRDSDAVQWDDGEELVKYAMEGIREEEGALDHNLNPTLKQQQQQQAIASQRLTSQRDPPSPRLSPPVRSSRPDSPGIKTRRLGSSRALKQGGWRDTMGGSSKERAQNASSGSRRQAAAAELTAASSQPLLQPPQVTTSGHASYDDGKIATSRVDATSDTQDSSTLAGGDDGNDDDDDDGLADTIPASLFTPADSIDSEKEYMV